MNTRRNSQGFAIRQGKSDFNHHFGGACNVRGADCPNCVKPLILHFSIDSSDPRLKLAGLGVPSIPLLYCMRCELCWYDFIYEFDTDNSITVIKAHRGAVTEEWQEEIGLDEFPRKDVTLLNIPSDIENLFDKLNFNDELTDNQEARIASFTNNYADPDVGGYPIVDVINQIGGRSFLSQRLDDPACGRCDQPMVFLASITNDPLQGVKLSYESVQIVFFLCSKCRRIHVQHSM